MNVKVYYIDCLTNLHVGSGDANFNIVDKEVEKDPVTGYPIVHASGIKGALREAYRKNHSEKETEKIFGKPATENESDTGGSYKFFDARFLYRPVRAGKRSLRERDDRGSDPRVCAADESLRYRYRLGHGRAG